MASWLLGAMVVASQASLGAEERAHVSLVDPATTKCTVCHKNVEATHQPEALDQRCQACHGFVKREDGTYLVDAQTAGDAAVPASASDREAITRLEAGPPPPRSVEGSSQRPGEPQSEAPGGQPVTAAELERSTAAAAAMAAGSGGGPPPGSAAVTPVELVRDQSRARYTAGLDAFHRGDIDAAFGAWEAMLDEAAGQYTIQIAVDRLLESARLALEAYPDQSLYVVPRGGAYYVLAGVFPSRASAAQGLARLPAELTRDGAFPTAVGNLIAAR